MRERHTRMLCGLAVGLALMSAACSARAAATAPSQTGSFSDPFAYCAAVGTVDARDARYTGPQVPDQVINGFKKAAGLQASTEPSDVFKKATFWRCMDGKVYACNVGANLPCESKADTNKTPTQAMMDYCTANVNSDFIPMSVTGHAMVYSWRCTQDKPELLQQISPVDARGYVANIWYPIEPGP